MIIIIIVAMFCPFICVHLKLEKYVKMFAFAPRERMSEQQKITFEYSISLEINFLEAGYWYPIWNLRQNTNIVYKE